MTRVLMGLLFLGGLFLLLSDPQYVAAQKGGNNGTVSKIDPKTGTITIKLLIVAKKKKELSDKEYFLNDDAKVTINESGERKTMTGKEALKDGAIKEGATVSFVPEGDLRIKELTVTEPKKKKKDKGE